MEASRGLRQVATSRRAAQKQAASHPASKQSLAAGDGRKQRRCSSELARHRVTRSGALYPVYTISFPLLRLCLGSPRTLEPPVRVRRFFPSHTPTCRQPLNSFQFGSSSCDLAAPTGPQEEQNHKQQTSTDTKRQPPESGSITQSTSCSPYN